ncbi:cold-regulated 413 plasma membrane protein 1 [Diospyros lotus]|uniref:cold-regulated 413 plasma membrane protein 1 n=1 Tax=Diospyros lotus TaxID=55363 RepID=UPI002257CA8D|nr:cold-regulated 413 plasma membrane protein 1 [Diospyros lotus]
MKKNYLAMKTGPTSSELITSDLHDLGRTTKRLANDAMNLTLGSGLATTLLQWVASVSAIYLLVLDRTNWKTNILTSLLVPYIFLSLPSLLFNLLRGEIGKWIAFVSVVLRLFFPKQFPDWLDMPGALILLLVTAPSLFADTVKDSWIGLGICLGIGCYLLQEHIRASGGFRNSFTKSNGISNTIGIIVLLVYPVWALIFAIL